MSTSEDTTPAGQRAGELPKRLDRLRDLLTRRQGAIIQIEAGVRWVAK
jgi:hypothetical protein